MKRLPKQFKYWTADEVAECAGVNRETYVELWNKMGDEDLKPLGGDGSNGTTEEPIHSSEYGNSMPQVWPRLSPEAQADVRRAAVAMALEDRADAKKYREHLAKSTAAYNYAKANNWQNPSELLTSW